MANLLNATTRHAFVSQQIERMKGPTDEAHHVLTGLQAEIEASTSLRLDPRDRAALRAYLSGVVRRLKTGEIDERAAHSGVDKLVMAAMANSPGALDVIHSGD